MNITVGTDPEVFFVDQAADTIYPAGMVFEEHFGDDIIEISPGALIPDGAALEFQPFPSVKPKEVVDNLRGLLLQGLTMAEMAGKALVIKPELPFDLKWCELDPKLGEFGCSPDQSTWGEGCTPATIDASKHRWRYAGCHIHLGIVGDQDYFRQDGVMDRSARALDRTVGLASMVLSGNHDRLRRQVYGRPGIYRHQPWGMEYRTPSNMILHSPVVMEFIFKLSQTIIELSVEHYETMKAVIPDDVVIQILRSDDIELAHELYMRMANVFCLGKLPARYTNWKSAWFGTKTKTRPDFVSDTRAARETGEWRSGAPMSFATARVAINAVPHPDDLPIEVDINEDMVF